MEGSGSGKWREQHLVVKLKIVKGGNSARQWP